MVNRPNCPDNTNLGGPIRSFEQDSHATSKFRHYQYIINNIDITFIILSDSSVNVVSFRFRI